MKELKKCLVCRCEEVTEEEVLKAIEEGAETLQEVKRATRVGMGLCQGRTCTTQVSKIAARAMEKSAAEIGQHSVRGPLRPTSIEVLAKGEYEEKQKASVAKGH